MENESTKLILEVPINSPDLLLIKDLNFTLYVKILERIEKYKADNHGGNSSKTELYRFKNIGTLFEVPLDLILID